MRASTVELSDMMRKVLLLMGLADWKEAAAIVPPGRLELSGRPY